MQICLVKLERNFSCNPHFAILSNPNYSWGLYEQMLSLINECDYNLNFLLIL